MYKRNGKLCGVRDSLVSCLVVLFMVVEIDAELNTENYKFQNFSIKKMKQDKLLKNHVQVKYIKIGVVEEEYK